MNKTEKIISLLLGGVLVWYLVAQSPAKQDARTAQAPASASAPADAAQAPASAAPAAPASPVAESAAPALPETPEEIVALENDELRLELSTWGGVVKKATLKKYAQNEGPAGEDNPPVEFDFSASPLGAVSPLRGSAPAAAKVFAVESASADEVVFACAEGRRKVSLGADYRVTIEDDWYMPGEGAAMALSLGAMSMGESKNDLLSVDSWQMDVKGGKVVHHDEGDSPLKDYLAGGVAGGCSSSRSAAGLPASSVVPYAAPQKWIALKNRFFVTALASTTAGNGGFEAVVARDIAAPAYRPASVSARVLLAPGGGKNVTSVFYVGPKKQALLWELGMKDVMEFGMWRWVCYPILWVLNVFNSAIPNYGIAIILLTILVRLVFWPLTHKSTVGMKKMQEIQPLMKELQAKYKDNPQRLQQETFALYKTHKVNPMSSCLPMLIQIPVFIALFNVLRSAVELRYAPFLWIGDLSQPEGLGADSWFPWFGGLNILPILMALTMGLQSALTPTTGDKNQQKMMVVFMPVMMLFMFYSFPAALSLYWTLSQVVSIVQMWVIRRQTAAANVPAVEVIDPPQTRQMRRHC